MSLALVLLLAAQKPVAQEAVPRTLTIDPGFEIAGHRIGDLDGDGTAEFVVVARDGRVRSFRPLAVESSFASGSGEPLSVETVRGLGELVLPAPERTLLDLAAWDGKSYLIALTPQGTLAYLLGEQPEEQGVVGTSGASWIPRGRLGLRLAAPTFAHIVQDVNRDGVNDIVVPTLGGVELWQATAEPGKVPSFRKAATVAVEVARASEHEFSALSDALAHSVSIPGLDTSDVNGDGRPDLIVAQGERRAWHLQRADASFPLEPDVTLDLGIFRDTTPAASTRFGGTASSGDDASFSTSDLDGDAVPDYVIVHRRKVWVFLGEPGGPQFTRPSDILLTAEDITALVVLPLDEDERADLLFVRLQIPTVATLLRGLFGEWDVAIRVLGYKNAGAGKFETSPSLSNDLALRLPGIIGLMQNPEQIVERFEELEQRFRGGARGDVDGDGSEDTLLVTSDGKTLELWLGWTGSPEKKDEEWFRSMLFDEPDAVWDLERVLATIGSLADRRATHATGGRPADRGIPLRDPEKTEVLAIECGDFDGDGGCEVVIAWRSREDSRKGGFDVLAFGRGE